MLCIAKCAQGEDIQFGDLVTSNNIGELVRAHKICTDPFGDEHGNLPIAFVTGIMDDGYWVVTL